ncbi:MAG: hypothetical protein HY455_01980 [Parcubacteria group bacterium]|nr:hypothetical protein [Parcubacteria group bacterium]
MLNFWEAQMRDTRIFLYSIAPFLEEAGALLLAGSHLWHTWSLNRKEELLRIAYELKGRAKLLRRSGLSWAANVSAFGESPAAVLASAAAHRSHPREKVPVCPEALPQVAGMATEILFTLLGVLEKAARDGRDIEGTIEWLSHIVETLSEAPYNSRPLTHVPEGMLRTLAEHAVLLECEGLAYTQATIEDSYNSKDSSRKRKKKSPLSDDKLHELASEFGMPFEVVKDIFETVASSWWDKATYFRDQAGERWETLISSLPTEDGVKAHIKIAWDIGGTAQDGRPSCWSIEELQKSEMIIQALISTLLFYVADRNPERVATMLGQKSRGKQKLLSPPPKLLEGPRHNQAQ